MKTFCCCCCLFCNIEAVCQFLCVCVSVRESLSLYVFDLIMKHMSIFYVLQDIKQRFKRVSLARNEAEWTLLITVCQTNNIFDGGQAVR